MAKGFNKGPAMGGQGGMMQQLQRMQKQMEEAQAKLAEETVTATAGGGAIKVIMTGGIGPHDLEALMDQDLEVRHHELGQAAGALSKIADALPGLGIVAAVLGVVITMESIGGPASEIGHKVGAALVGTFLGILLSYGFVQPLASSLEQRVNDNGHYEQCIKTGLLAMYKGFPPMVAVEFARRVLPSEVRPSFDETEELVKGAKAEAAAA